MKNSESVTFAGGTIDRAAHLRGDSALLARLRQADNARAMALWRGKPLVDTENGAALVWLSPDSPLFGESQTEPVFLGLQAGKPRFAFDIPDWEGVPENATPAFYDSARTPHPALPESCGFVDLRQIMGQLPHSDAGDAASAKGIFEWHKTHAFCANCGAGTRISQAGWQRECPACGRQHFPRTDPVVIMLVLSGNEVLLGRSPHWPGGMFSLLAGFMEPGETIEEAVRREVSEETGVQTGAVGYLASQPWPFPSSLMIGCHAQALSRDIETDGLEIEEARWVRREDLAQAICENDPTLMPGRKGSIARYLLDRWLADTLAG